MDIKIYSNALLNYPLFNPDICTVQNIALPNFSWYKLWKSAQMLTEKSYKN